MNGVIYISKCSGCGTYESVSVSPTPKGCVLVLIRDENGDCVGHDSAYAFKISVATIDKSSKQSQRQEFVYQGDLPIPVSKMKISREIYLKMLSCNCNKSKHRFVTNNQGITFCVICGLLSNKATDNKAEPLIIE